MAQQRIKISQLLELTLENLFLKKELLTRDALDALDREAFANGIYGKAMFDATTKEYVIEIPDPIPDPVPDPIEEKVDG